MRREKSQNSISDDVLAADINALNGYMADANKAACDNQLGASGSYTQKWSPMYCTTIAQYLELHYVLAPFGYYAITE